VSNYYPKIEGKTLYFEFNLLSQSQYISDLSLSSHFILSFSLSQVFPFHAQTTQRRKEQRPEKGDGGKKKIHGRTG
jgi:hypothetical protein